MLLLEARRGFHVERPREGSGRRRRGRSPCWLGFGCCCWSRAGGGGGGKRLQQGLEALRDVEACALCVRVCVVFGDASYLNIGRRGFVSLRTTHWDPPVRRSSVNVAFSPSPSSTAPARASQRRRPMACKDQNACQCLWSRTAPPSSPSPAIAEEEGRGKRRSGGRKARVLACRGRAADQRACFVVVLCGVV